MKLLAIDGNSLMNRAYYGIKALSTKDGIFTNALYGFLNIYFKVYSEIKPDCCAVAFDLREPTFRHKASPEYKATRHGMDDELAMQMPYIKEILTYMGVTVLEKPGFEADDILGTLSALADDENECYILTGDRDSLQLITENVTVLLHTNKGEIRFTPEHFAEEYSGLGPKQLIDLKGLMGDTSDNISGVKGIGQKTATELMVKYGSIEKLYAALDSGEAVGTKSVMTKLEAGREDAKMSRYLAEIVKNVPIPDDMDSYRYKEMQSEELAKLLTRLEMTKILTKLELKPIRTDIPEKVKAPAVDIGTFTVTDTAPTSDFCFILNGNSHGGTLCTVSERKCWSTNDPAAIAQILSSDVKKTAFDAKEAYKLCFEQGKKLTSVTADVFIAAYLLDTNAKEYTVSGLCGEYGVPYNEKMGEFADVCSLAALSAVLDTELDTQSLTSLYKDIELPLTEVLASMEHEGIAVDSEGIKEFGRSLEGDMKELEQRIYFRAGHQFNIASPKQLGTVLFEEMGLPSGKKTKTGYSTNADVLAEIADKDPIIGDILQYRQYAKLQSTYVEGLLKQVEEDGRIHTIFRQTETRTGRISSTEPNLQNIPVRTELGRNMRKFFIAQGEKLFIDADYSQIELRILASLSDDENMKKSFLSGEDIHTATAAQVFGMPLSMVTPEMRRAAKAVNFGIVYGIGAFSLAKDIEVSVKQAERYIKNYLDNFSGVRDFMQRSVEDAKQKGYSLTLFGRRRYVPELTAKNKNIQQFGRRVAMNAPVQGTAADIIKIAMIRVYKRLSQELPDAKLVLQIHDELIIEASKADSEKAAQILAEEMPRAAELSVPLIADVHTGKSWFETH
ncbi:MAG: DNA polymerase I [Oscillospiraceae bacterium]|nr:DNA polymerase I [Oscillospiraceae bacterium]